MVKIWLVGAQGLGLHLEPPSGSGLPRLTIVPRAELEKLPSSGVFYPAATHPSLHLHPSHPPPYAITTLTFGVFGVHLTYLLLSSLCIQYAARIPECSPSFGSLQNNSGLLGAAKIRSQGPEVRR